MAVEKDKHIDPNVKARWGFGLEGSRVTVGPKTVGETGGVENVRTEPEKKAARKTGGGAKSD